METPDKIIRKVRPFFLNYFNKLGNDLNTLTAAPVVCALKGVTLLRGEDDLMGPFEMDMSVAYVREDGLNVGDVHLVFDVTTSIALTGLMMMMGEAIIQAQVKSREYNEEIQEGFQEVSNQVVGSMNELVEKKMPDGGHLFLESTELAEFGSIPATLRHDTTYLDASVDIRVADFPSATGHWLLSKELAEVLLNIEIDGTPEEEERAVARQAAAHESTLPPTEEPEASPEPDEPVFEAKEDAKEDAEEEKSDAREPQRESPELAFPSASSVQYTTTDGLPSPDDPGSLKVLMTEVPFSMKEDDRVIQAINAMRQDGYRYIGVERKGKLIRVVSQSDLRQIMGPFFGTKAMSPRDKAICTIPIGKLNESQQLIRAPIGGTINQAADLIKEFNLRALPVVSKTGVLRGFIPVHAVLDYFRKKKQV